jgi:hypothetical protein
MHTEGSDTVSVPLGSKIQIETRKKNAEQQAIKRWLRSTNKGQKEGRGGTSDLQGDECGRRKIKETVLACWNVQGMKSKIGIPEFREALKGVDIFGVIETWTAEKDEIELDGYRYVSRIRKANDQVGRCSGGVGIFYKEKLYPRVQLLNNVGPNVLWIILKADEGKEGKVCIGVCYNPPRGSKYENTRFFEELESEALEIKSTMGGLDIIVMGDLNDRCGDLIPRGLIEEEEEENSWCKDNLFAVSGRRSEDKVVNEEGRELISFCEILILEILNSSREGDVEGKMTFVWKTGASVTDYRLCSYDIGRFLYGRQVRV